jgi:predicted ribosome quality control (RQC) complex YloA/Tae2 family protein
MKTRTFFAALSLGFLASCAQMSPHEPVQNPTVRKAAQSARTRSDHDALTKYFEHAANEMQAKAEEQKRLLQQYEEKSYLYGREAQDLISHTTALVRKYSETAQENRKEAALHRQMALEQGQSDSTARSGKMAGAAFMEEQQKSN